MSLISEKPHPKLPVRWTAEFHSGEARLIEGQHAGRAPGPFRVVDPTAGKETSDMVEGNEAVRQALIDKPALTEQITQAIYAKRNASVEAAK